MSAYKKILVLVDPSMRETKALQRAQRIAWRQGAELHLCLVDYSAAIRAAGTISHNVMKLAKRAFIEEREVWLKEQAEEIESTGVKVYTEVIWGEPPHEKAIAKIMAVKPDLVIKDVGGESVVKRLFSPSLDTRLVRMCPFPLLLVHQGAKELPHRVTAAVDIAHTAIGADDLNQRIVGAARELAENCKATLDVAFAFEGLPTLPALPEFGEVYGYGQMYQEFHNVQEQDFTAFARRQGVAREYAHFLSGPPVQAIPDYVEESGTDVIVVGTAYHDTLDRFMLGSTSESLVHHLDCDVLVVKPANFIERLGAEPAAASADMASCDPYQKKAA